MMFPWLWFDRDVQMMPLDVVRVLVVTERHVLHEGRLGLGTDELRYLMTVLPPIDCAVALYDCVLVKPQILGEYLLRRQQGGFISRIPAQAKLSSYAETAARRIWRRNSVAVPAMHPCRVVHRTNGVDGWAVYLYRPYILSACIASSRSAARSKARGRMQAMASEACHAFGIRSEQAPLLAELTDRPYRYDSTSLRVDSDICCAALSEVLLDVVRRNEGAVTLARLGR